MTAALAVVRAAAEVVIQNKASDAFLRFRRPPDLCGSRMAHVIEHDARPEHMADAADLGH